MSKGVAVLERKRAYENAYRLKNLERRREQGREAMRRRRTRLRALGLQPDVPRRVLSAGTPQQVVVTQAQADELFARTNGLCAICSEPATCIDHEHQTRHLRGALCRSCNSGLGMFHDDPIRMAAAIRYVLDRGTQPIESPVIKGKE